LRDFPPGSRGFSSAGGFFFVELEIKAPLHVLEGSTGEVIRQAAAMEDADLVVVGRGHLNEQMGQLRTHAYEIIWNSPCPVLSL
jgi:nucleotide-binding universal stress UspA family protein